MKSGKEGRGEKLHQIVLLYLLGEEKFGIMSHFHTQLWNFFCQEVWRGRGLYRVNNY
jgi:hypothetical protein